MNKTQRIHAIKRVLREDFSSMQIEKINTDKFNPLVLDIRLRPSLRSAWAEKIEKVLSEDKD